MRSSNKSASTRIRHTTQVRKATNGNGSRAPAATRDRDRERALAEQPAISEILGAAARTDGDTTRQRDSQSLDRAQLLQALMALKKGDFSVRLPSDLEGMEGKIADTFNDVI